MPGEATVVGGGISGLSAALRLAEAGVAVTLVEGSPRLGGKIRTDHGLEAGAENFLMRDPGGGPSAAVELVREVGLDDLIVHPTGLPAGLYVDGSLRPLPGGTFLGIPGPDTVLGDVASLSGSDVDTGEPVLTGDVAVGELVRRRMGGQIVTRLVDPLLGGVYAGHADRLSVAATMPGLYHLLRGEHTLTAAVKRASRPPTGAPVFGTIAGGLSLLVDAVRRRLIEHGVRIQLGEPVRALAGTPTVLAIPGNKAARLLPPAAAAQLGEIEYASVGLVTLEFPPCDLPDLSGFLVPETEGLTIKAATFFSRKWEHVPGVVVRVSLGRAGQAAVLRAHDDSLVETALRDLSTVVGGLPGPKGAKVDRWGGGLPQYAPGHLTRVAAARQILADTPIGLAGAAYDGIGIPACVKSGRQAAELLLQKWLS